MTTNLKVPGRKSWTQRLRNEMAANWQLYLLVLLPVVYLILFHYWPMLGVQIAFKISSRPRASGAARGLPPAAR